MLIFTKENLFMSKTNQVFICILLLAIFSSFGYAQKSSQADFSKKIEEATPKSLPQTPVVKRLTSDAQDDGLKGKVKSLVEEREGLTGIEKPIGRRLSSTTDFDEQGNCLKEVYFEYRGRPYNVRVYGYIDNQRVSLSKLVDIREGFDTDSGRPRAENNTKPDTRYTFKYEYKYENGKLSEMQLFNNKGGKSMRYVYKFKQNQMEKLAYTEDNELNSKYLYTFDKNGIESGRIDLVPGNDKFQYQNVIIDEKGNWTKRTFSRLENKNGKEFYEPIAIEYRTITYYPQIKKDKFKMQNLELMILRTASSYLSKLEPKTLSNPAPRKLVVRQIDNLAPLSFAAAGRIRSSFYHEKR